MPVNIEQKTLTSVEVAEMVGKDHHKLLRDIRNYIDQLNQYLQDVITGCNAQIRMDGDSCGV